MFSQIIRSVNLDVESSTDASDEFNKLLKLSKKSRLEYEGKENLFHRQIQMLVNQD